ncbi:MAG: ATP-dependent RecD-like DNA helicase [Aureispira sp.]|nr:ATP-dependent RecD-like DNA helicase [Aureispira sp.]
MLEKIEGSIEHISFRNEDNGFTVAKMLETGKTTLTIVVGVMMGVQVGEILVCTGNWKTDKRFGVQFDVKNFEVKVPSTVQGIEKYLASGLISGIGATFAKRIVKRFGVDTLDIIENAPTRLLDVEGLGKKKLERILNSWKDQKNIRNVMLFLQQYNVSPAYAQRIFKQYQQESVQKVKENPYRLASDVVGIGFKKADEIAKAMGISQQSPMRLDAAIEYNLLQLAKSGHTCYPLEEFMEATATKLHVAATELEERLTTLVFNKKIIIESIQDGKGRRSFIWAKLYYRFEQQIAEEIERLKSFPPRSKVFNLDEIGDITQKMGIVLAEQQEMAVQQSLQSKIHIITGGPGTGKSTITNVVVQLFKKNQFKVLLAAPTGRAAKRLSEITGEEAQTLHSLLSFDFGIRGFRKNYLDPLECDVLIVDESSMIDSFLMDGLLRAISDHTQLVLVGDIDQLPSVGAGNVLKDLMDSGKIDMTRLTEIFRQAVNSRIVINAHKINQGVFPNVEIDKQSDFFFIKEHSPEKINNTIISLLSGRLKKAYGFHPLKDIQLISPMNKGELGTQRLNQLMQKALNSGKKGKDTVERGQITFRVGDKVMQIRNNYDKEVFNGDIGYIKRISSEDKLLVVNIDKNDVEYQFSELNELELAYAVSVHKYQGSESPCIIMPIHEQHYRLLYRNLLYTGITRGKKLVVLIGTSKALNIAIQNNHVNKRYTGLKQALDPENSTGLPVIKVVPMLGSAGYEDWVAEHFPEVISE